MSYNISIIGLGKLGSCMLAAYASKGHRAIGVDVNVAFVDAINNGKAPVDETDLQRYITENRKYISATTDYNEAVPKSDITFIIVPTPSDETGGFSVEFAKKACTEIGKALKKKEGYHLVVLTSTVLPGDCERHLIPVLEEASGKKCGKDFGFCYSPEFIAIGSVVKDLLNPDFFLIGEYDKKSGDMLEGFYSGTSNNQARIKRMNIPSAELTKISVNHFLTTKITFANMLCEVAGKIPGVNVDVVTDALGSDTRIGSKYLKGGLGYGGPCFPRDNRAFNLVAKKRGVDVPFAKRVDDYNASISEKVKEYIVQHCPPGAKIGIVGLSYKPNTYFCEESQGLFVAKKLSEGKHDVKVFEYHGYSHAETLLGDCVDYKKSLEELAEDSDVLFLTNLDKNNQKLKEIPFKTKKMIIDPWRQFSSEDFSDMVTYLPLGIGKTE